MTRPRDSKWEITKTVIGWAAALLVFVYGLVVQHSANEASTREIIQEMRGDMRLLEYRITALEAVIRKPTADNNKYSSPIEAILPDALRRPKLLTLTTNR